jgi:hypothetical protein
MRRTAFLLSLLVCAAAARGQGNSDFPQTQGQSNQGFGGSSEFTQTRPQPSSDFGSGSGWGKESAPASPQYDGSNAAAGPGGGPGSGAQGVNGGGDQKPRPGPNERIGKGSGDGASDDSDSTEDAPPSAMTLDDARVNFATVVEAYVAKNSPDGYWPYSERKGGKGAKSRRLTHPKISDKSVEKSGDARYSGLVKLRDARGGRSLTLEFVVDLSGLKWKVVSVKPARGQ